jgi:hypothetical protein
MKLESPEIVLLAVCIMGVVGAVIWWLTQQRTPMQRNDVPSPGECTGYPLYPGFPGNPEALAEAMIQLSKSIQALTQQVADLTTRLSYLPSSPPSVTVAESFPELPQPATTEEQIPLPSPGQSFLAPALRGEVYRLADFGMVPEHIARTLGISCDEVELLLHLRQVKVG